MNFSFVIYLENLVKDEPPVWKEDLFTPFGKWMDGWESRRRRTEGHDWCIIKLGFPGVIKMIEIDTAFFTGNFSPKASVQGINLGNQYNKTVEQLIKIRSDIIRGRKEFGKMGLAATNEEFTLANSLDSQSWPFLVNMTPLGAGYEETRRSYFKVEGGHGPLTHLRLNMGPDGGIARIRVYGEIVINPETIPFNKEIDLAAAENGGLAISCSNRHYGHPRLLKTKIIIWHSLSPLSSLYNSTNLKFLKFL